MTVVLVTLALLIANAIFVAAEFAVIGVSRTAVEHRANQGDSLARRILGLLTLLRPAKFGLGCTLLCTQRTLIPVN